LAEELNDLRMRTRELGNAGPPAEEEASRGQIKAVYQHAKVCAEIHDQMYEYAHQYKQRLDEALATLQESDQDAQETVHNTGKGLGWLADHYTVGCALRCCWPGAIAPRQQIPRQK